MDNVAGFIRALRDFDRGQFHSNRYRYRTFWNAVSVVLSSASIVTVFCFGKDWTWFGIICFISIWLIISCYKLFVFLYFWISEDYLVNRMPHEMYNPGYFDDPPDITMAGARMVGETTAGGHYHYPYQIPTAAV